MLCKCRPTAGEDIVANLVESDEKLQSDSEREET